MTKVKLNRKPTKAGNGSLLKTIWDENDLYGITTSVHTIILPSDSIELVQRLDTLKASKATYIHIYIEG